MRAARSSFALIVAGAIAISVIAGTAIAAPNGNVSTVDFSASPSALPQNSSVNARLNIHTHTDYAVPRPALSGDLSRLQFEVDNDFTFDPSARPKCSESDWNYIGAAAMKQAMARCGNAKVGAGSLVYNVSNPFVAPGCILFFNAERDDANRPQLLMYTRGGTNDCSDPANNTTGNWSVAAPVVIRDDSGDYGSLLDIKNVAQWDGFAWEDLDFTISGAGFVQGRCHDTASLQNLRTTFTYGDGQSDVVTASDPCTVG
jgi:hypothetical protein